MMTNNENNLFYTCSLIEYIARLTMNDKIYIVNKMGYENINKIYTLADVYHCENIDKVASEIIDKCNIKNGNYNVFNCTQKVPSYYEIGKIYMRLIIMINNDENSYITNLIKVMSSWIVKKLDNYNNCGNMLIDGRTGEILRMPQASTIICSLNDQSNYYTMEIYDTEIDKKTGNKVVTGRSYNFLDADGKIVNAERNFTLSPDGYSITQFLRKYYDREGGKVIHDSNIYPEGYVVVEGRFINFYESSIALIEENRYRLSNGYTSLIDNEEKYLADLYARKNMLDHIVTTYGIKYDEDKITDGMYSRLMSKINDEYDKYEEFEEKFETDADRKFAENLDNTLGQN